MTVRLLTPRSAGMNERFPKVFQAEGAIDGASSAGTAFNESHIPEHKCYVLGQLLDTADLVAPLAIEY